MDDEGTSGIVNNVVQYASTSGAIAAAVGYRVLNTIVGGDLGSSGSTSSSTSIAIDEDKGLGSPKASSIPSIASKDWLLGRQRNSSSSQQYSAIGLDKEYSLPLFTLQDVSFHEMPYDCWVVIYDRVYNVTPLLTSHPGGEEVMLEYAGADATIAFRGVGHSKEAEESLKPYLVGILVENERIWNRFFNMKSDIP